MGLSFQLNFPDAETALKVPTDWSIQETARAFGCLGSVTMTLLVSTKCVCTYSDRLYSSSWMICTFSGIPDSPDSWHNPVCGYGGTVSWFYVLWPQCALYASLLLCHSCTTWIVLTTSKGPKEGKGTAHKRSCCLQACGSSACTAASWAGISPGVVWSIGASAKACVQMMATWLLEGVMREECAWDWWCVVQHGHGWWAHCQGWARLLLPLPFLRWNFLWSRNHTNY